jgi:hypothetical protein
VHNVAGHTNDLVAFVANAQDDSLPEWIFIREELSDELLADNRDFVALSHFLLSEIAPAQEWNA